MGQEMKNWGNVSYKEKKPLRKLWFFEKVKRWKNFYGQNLRKGKKFFFYIWGKMGDIKVWNKKNRSYIK